MLEWPAVRAAAREALPRHFAVTCWKHAGAAAVEQHGVEDTVKDRGAEQGDPLGSILCGLVLLDVLEEHKASVREQLVVGGKAAPV